MPVVIISFSVSAKDGNNIQKRSYPISNAKYRNDEPSQIILQAVLQFKITVRYLLGSWRSYSKYFNWKSRLGQIGRRYRF